MHGDCAAMLPSAFRRRAVARRRKAVNAASRRRPRAYEYHAAVALAYFDGSFCTTVAVLTMTILHEVLHIPPHLSRRKAPRSFYAQAVAAQSLFQSLHTNRSSVAHKALHSSYRSHTALLIAAARGRNDNEYAAARIA